ncbi:glucose-6-phosphate isomerase [Psychroflexus sp. YR1-1]|uniref:Glucose-6-phosphate isomerase n=1 Tax=Psychroflexus aurantiacus TaxID=2709310 RepID=A0A6B3R0P1_9FLAO|nr:glucose-6-phosphate isomerase [Psychroflexus aurantiacus]NEV94163.1 glucose-6-phosphate isomerase [Psychroflexus aurantiacus]
MSLQSLSPVDFKSWKELESLSKHKFELSALFNANPKRFQEFSIRNEDVLVDFSKNLIDEEVFRQLLKLAEEANLKKAIKSYFEGDEINETEGRAVLHTALRTSENNSARVDGKEVYADVQSVLAKMKTFADQVNSGERTSYAGKKFTDVVNIGIGGSDLGPQMIVDALAYYQEDIKPHFISNVDGDHVLETLKHLNPETTLFLIVSKSFSTQETLTNANTVRDWFLKSATQEDVKDNFVAVSTNISAVEDFGIDTENIFPMYDWVGGRFSLWSAAGLSIAVSVGSRNFQDLLDGAEDMDRHFKTSDFKDNIPVVLALLGIWYNNFLGAESEAIIPYTQYLQKLAPYLQQASMESNGKSVDRAGNRVNYQTGTIVWGEPGTNSQHAFFQLIHQGTKLIPSDFIGFKKSLHGNSTHHDILMANYFAQTEALMKGKSSDEVHAELKNQGLSPEEIQNLLPFKVFEGNKPTTSILIDQLTPKSLGKLVSMYEHKIFVQGVIWNIFSYDQWGVELGKQLAKNTLSDILSDRIENQHDSSTTELLYYYKS